MPAIDIEQLKEIMDNDTDLIQDCFSDFCAECPPALAQLKAAAKVLDFEQIDNVAHKIKGMVQYLAAEPAAQAAQVVETAGKKNEDENLDEKINILETRCQSVMDFIDGFSSS